MIVSAPVSIGELIDKITILRIKTHLIDDQYKLDNVNKELRLLEDLKNTLGLNLTQLDSLEQDLYNINRELWDIENFKRSCEHNQLFNEQFIAAARQVYLKNDRRAQIKRDINLLTNSTIVEEKHHSV